MNKLIIKILLFVFVLSSITCRRPNREQAEDNNTAPGSLLEINKILVKKDAEKIKNYVKQRNWEMDETKTGLWYMIYEKGSGKKAEKNKIAIIDYSVELLDSTECYNSDSLGVKQFKIGEGGVETGLEEGILLLQEGDKAKLIMPPHLAHGLIGDENCIPARAILVYDVYLKEIKDYQ